MTINSETESANRVETGTFGPTLAQCLAGRSDNFTLLRLIAAAAVILGHSYSVAAIPGLNDFIAWFDFAPGMYSGSLAVDIFFVISGFLVTGSWVRRPQFWAFCKSRMLRVLPGYTVCVVLTALVLGPILTTLSIRDYYSHPETWGYIWGNMHFTAMQLRWSLPGVFTSNPLPNIVNGSLWTLPAEMQMYLWLAVLGLIGLFKRPAVASLALIGLIFSTVKFPGWCSEFLLAEYLHMAGLFMTGALFYLNAQRIRINSILLAALCLLCFLLRDTPRHGYLLGLTIVYATLWFAYIPKISSAWIRGDYSYGLYLWGFPIQQTIVLVLGEPQPMTVFTLALPIAFMFAVASWHLIEKPALALKYWGRSRATPAAARHELT